MRLFLVCLTFIVALLQTPSLRAAATSTDGRWQPDIAWLSETLDREQALSLNDVLQSNNWRALPGGSPNFGYVEEAFWFRFPLPETGLTNPLIEISYPQLDYVDLYLLRDGQPVHHLRTGDRLPFAERAVAHPNFLFPLNISEPGHYEVVLRVESRGALQVPITVWDPRHFFEHITVLDQAHAIYYGMLLVIIFFNLVVFLVMRESTYLYYVLSTLGYLMLFACLRGVTFPLLWPESPGLQNQAMLLSIPLALLFSCLFARVFLELKKDNPRLDLLIKTGAGISFLSALASFVIDYNLSIRLSVALAVPTCLLLTVAGPIQWLRHSRPARFYSVAWGALTIGSALAALNKYGLINTGFLTEFGMEIGSALEAILLTVALADRLYREREEKVRAQDSQLHEHTVRRKAELKLIDQAMHHPLTHQPNRTCFYMLLQDVLRNEAENRHVIAIVQLMNYHSINKTLGHSTTDRLMEFAARRLNELTQGLPGIRVIEQTEKNRHCIANLEAGIFAFILDPEIAGNDPRNMAHYTEQLREPVDYLGMLVPLDPVIGISIYPDHATDANTLIRQAYIAQETEEARFKGLAYYQPALDFYSAERLTLVSDIKRALLEYELALAFQPKLCLQTREIIGVEALIRWPKRKASISPQDLIHVAEQTGLIKPITRWVMEQAIKARETLLSAGYDLSMAVNISAINLREPDFPLFVQRLLAATRTPSGKLALELTETAMMLDPGNSLIALRSLESTGIPLSIDDFGSGYSSLSYIKQLPAREIKIDRSLITELSRQADDRVIVETTIAMCHSLGYTVVAEGVEDLDTLELLAGMQCDVAQGYVLTPPLPLDELLDWLQQREADSHTS